jgi:outer membrane biosynthesis protein TonB
LARSFGPYDDLATGAVTNLKVLKSTGVKILDDSAAAAFLQWRAKPHFIDHAILPVQFGGTGYPLLPDSL